MLRVLREQSQSIERQHHIIGELPATDLMVNLCERPKGSGLRKEGDGRKQAPRSLIPIWNKGNSTCTELNHVCSQPPTSANMGEFQGGHRLAPASGSLFARHFVTSLRALRSRSHQNHRLQAVVKLRLCFSLTHWAGESFISDLH